MLVASNKVELFERYRVPYRIDPSTAPPNVLRIARDDGAGAALLCVAGQRSPEHYLLDGSRLYVSLADEPAIREAMPPESQWDGWLPIHDLDGAIRSSLRRSADGDVLLPFDLDAPFDAMLNETYLEGTANSRLQALIRKLYYPIRPFLPRSVVLALRRGFSRVQERAAFPAWPIETSLHRLEALALSIVDDVCGAPVPWIWPWPEPYRWALVLTHDVENAVGYRNVAALQSIEQKHRVRSAWYFVPERDYVVESSTLAELREAGCEVCLHGLTHDGHDLDPPVFHRRAPAMRSYLERWGSVGFRSPATHRNAVLLKELPIAHDSSWSDVARYEPQPGGTGSWLPFFIGEVVELPITMPMDHTLFDILGDISEQRWVEKAALLREHGGMGVLLTHPDYLLEPERLATYDRFLTHELPDPETWLALPVEVASWWKRRAASTIVRDGDGWKVEGPAAPDASIRLGAPPPPAVAHDRPGKRVAPRR